MPDRILLQLTALTPLAHGEAGANSTGPNNTTLFNRQLQRLSKATAGADEADAKAALANLLTALPIGADTFPLMESLKGSELVAALFVAQVPIMFPGDGEGLFTGMERYRMLSTRLADGAKCSSTLPELWSYLSRKLMLPMFPTYGFEAMRAFFILPKAIQGQAIQAISKALELIVMAARMMAESIKAENKAAKNSAGNLSLFSAQVYQVTSEQLADLTRPKAEAIVMPVPSISGNALRHCLIREPGANRLIQALGLEPYSDRPGEHLGLGVTRFLYGGGQLAAKAKAPSASDIYEAQIRSRYPIVDAVGGSTDSWMMAESACKVAGWVVCAENNVATSAIAGVESQVSIFDYLSEETKTRSGIGGKDKESGQMIFSYETLAAGLPVIVEILFNPFTQPLTIGAVWQAVEDWAVEGGIVGGRSQIGHSRFAMEILQGSYGLQGEAYLDYLEAERDSLRDGLLDATMGTGAVLCAA
jgi:hypothetical protein